MAITLECGQTVKLIAENIEGTADVAFVKPGAVGVQLAAAEAKAKTDAETNAKANAIADVTRQQNEIKCAGEKCNKLTPAPTSAITVAGKAVPTFNADRSGNAHGTAKATGKGTVECKAAG